MKIDDESINTKTKKVYTPVRLCFQSARLAQDSIARLIRARFKGTVSDFDYKSLLYGFNIWLGFDKHLKAVDIEKRLERMEALLQGEGSTVIESSDIDSQYAQVLRRQLSEAEQSRASLEKKLMEAERKIRDLRYRTGNSQDDDE